MEWAAHTLHCQQPSSVVLGYKGVCCEGGRRGEQRARSLWWEHGVPGAPLTLQGVVVGVEQE